MKEAEYLIDAYVLETNLSSYQGGLHIHLLVHGY